MTTDGANRTLKRMTALFLAIFVLLIPVLLQVIQLSRSLKVPVVLTCGIIAAAILYLGSLIPGAFGHYSPMPVCVSTVVLELMVFCIFWKFQGGSSKLTALTLELAPESQAGPWNILTIILLIAAAVSLGPLYQYSRQLPELLFSPSTKLNWDVVSYHLPALAEFIRAHSLWSVDGPYQSFSQGYELFGGLSVLFFHSPWGFVIANTVSVSLIVAAVIYMSSLLRTLLTPENLHANQVLIIVMSLGLWISLFPDDVSAVGKNDLFEAATLMAAFCYLLDFISSSHQRSRRIALLILASVAYGLSISTKPPSLFYLPLFALMSGFSVPANESSVHARKYSFSLLTSAATIGGAMLIGGFFEMRNVFVFHHLFAPDLAAETSRMSIAHQWRHLELYNPFDKGAIYALNWLVISALLFYWQKQKIKFLNSVPVLCLVFFNLSGLISFAFMPTSVVIEAGAMDFQDRKIMAVYAVTGILVAIFISAKSAGVRIIRIQPVVIAVSAIASLLFIPVINHLRQRADPPGLPGYDQVKGLPRTRIYEWVQSSPVPQRIYAAGLRPWGLYGRNLQNDLFYDLHSHILDREGELRLLAIMKQFHPGLILISVDPHGYTGSPRKPSVVDWLRSQKCFTEVYNDETVSGFKVNDGWEALLKQVSIPIEPIRMHG